MKTVEAVEEKGLVAVPRATMKALVYHGPGRKAFR
jgi:hypothetical protein